MISLPSGWILFGFQGSYTQLSLPRASATFLCVFSSIWCCVFSPFVTLVLTANIIFCCFTVIPCFEIFYSACQISPSPAILKLFWLNCNKQLNGLLNNLLILGLYRVISIYRYNLKWLQLWNETKLWIFANVFMYNKV